MLARRFIFAAALGLAAASPSWAQAPFTDPAQGPVMGQSLPHVAGRAVNRPEILTAVAPFVTAPLNTNLLMAEDAQQIGGALRMGVVQPVNLSSATAGLWTQMADGGWLWVARLEASGALGVRVQVSPWPPPAGAQVTLYNADDFSEVFGPLDAIFLTGDRSYWSPNIYSPRVVLEYYLPPGADHLAAPNQIRIENLLNEYRTPQGNAGGGGVDELGCHLDVTCFGAWTGEASGVAALSSISNQFGFFCSGSLLNRTAGDFTPIFQTATHCGVTTGNASTILVTWFYQTTTCNVPGSVPPLNTLNQSQGVALLGRDVTNDWTVFGLQDTIPGGVQFEGWDSNFLGNGSSIINISHPAGAYKRIAFGTEIDTNGSRPDPANPPSCVGFASYHTNFLAGNGLCEPGSSGSPLFDTAHRVRAALSCGSTPTCSGTNSNTWGRLDQAFPTVGPFLAPPDPVFANVAYGGFEAGTIAQPFQTLQKSRFSVIAGHNIFMSAGTYHELLTIRKPMTLNTLGGVVTIGP